ncbi:hypothetical protein [Paraburkholderia kururiensis]|uniref:hypothetical protein n=1 Tax=Paraburkholderia kururiensis TaxID=984307 RepID=UPI000F87106B|nr:hypothetical protein [Paraburkholderia kururiensis]
MLTTNQRDNVLFSAVVAVCIVLLALQVHCSNSEIIWLASNAVPSSIVLFLVICAPVLLALALIYGTARLRS